MIILNKYFFKRQRMKMAGPEVFLVKAIIWFKQFWTKWNLLTVIRLKNNNQTLKSYIFFLRTSKIPYSKKVVLKKKSV